jgi:peptidyl-prolyl cis-trans isomerase SurA
MKIIILLFFLVSISVYADTEIKIELKINNDVITNYDLKKYEQYLTALNTNLSNLDKETLEKITKNSIINEKIKINELEKYFDLKKENNFLDNFLKEYYLRMSFKTKADFEKHLSLYDQNIEIIKEKLNIELMWNQLIFDKFNNQVKINEEKIIEEINNQQKINQNILSYNLSEILFELKKNETLQEKYELIKKSISAIGFENTASLYSISESSNSGGKIGQVDQNNISNSIYRKIKDLKSGETSEPIKVKNNFLILKINEINEVEKIFNFEKEVSNLIQIKRNEQLNNFSKIYLDKIKINTAINEY